MRAYILGIAAVVGLALVLGCTSEADNETTTGSGSTAVGKLACGHCKGECKCGAKQPKLTESDVLPCGCQKGECTCAAKKTDATNAPETATVGNAAPDFTLADSTGAEHSLADFRGKFVVLEWTNPDCPFVRAHYDSGNMQACRPPTRPRTSSGCPCARRRPASRGTTKATRWPTGSPR